MKGLWRNTLILLVISGGFAVWLWFDHKKGVGNEGLAGDPVALFDFSGPEVSRIELKRPSENLVAEKKDGRWQIISPRNLPGNGPAIDQMLRYADPMTKASPLPPGEKPPDVAVHGLDAPVLELTLATDGGKKSSIVFGKSVGAGDRVYVRRAGKNEVLTIETWLINNLNGSVQSLRDPGLCRFDPKDLEEVNFETPAQKMRVARRGKGWVLSGAVEDLGEPGPVEEWTSVISGAVTTKFEARTQSRAEYGLDPAFATIEVRLKSRTIKVAIGAPIEAGASRRWADTSDYPDEIGTVQNVDFELATPKPATLRSQHILPWPLGDATTLASSGDSEYDARKTGGRWTLVKPVLLTRFQPDRVEFLVKELAATPVLGRPPAGEAPAGAIHLSFKWDEGAAVVEDAADIWTDGTDTFVRTVDPVRVVRAQTTQAWDHAVAGALFFRDPHISDLMPIQVKTIIIEKAGHKWVEAVFEGARTWTETKPAPGKDLDESKITELNALWTGMVADTWVREAKDLPAVGIAGTPAWKIRIQPDPSRTSTATELVYLVGNAGPRGTLYAMVEGEEGVFLASPAAVNALVGGVWK